MEWVFKEPLSRFVDCIGDGSFPFAYFLLEEQGEFMRGDVREIIAK